MQNALGQQAESQRNGLRSGERFPVAGHAPHAERPIATFGRNEKGNEETKEKDTPVSVLSYS